MRRTPFLVGIDLGTTNSTVAAIDTRREAQVDVFPILQVTASGRVEPRRVLPSFLYFAEPHEIESGSVALPWDRAAAMVAGEFARDRGALAPARQVTSAKSWLVHAGVDRHARLLPWGADVSAPRLSPVEAATAFLAHIRDAWNTTMASTDSALRLERQTIVLTVPASFDEEARELTVEAAGAAQLTELTLLEEPVAAFYAWIRDHDVAGALQHDDNVALVCDVGGGTTDFSLIRVTLDHGAPVFERMAIGDHLLLGGDNLDLALAGLVERKISEQRPGAGLALPERQGLRRQCSAAKERLLGDDPPPQVTITLLGAGRAVVGGAVSVALTGHEVQRTLEDFLPATAPGDIGGSRTPRVALRELGLPYESDPAITRHLAAFLARSAAVLNEGHRAINPVGGRPMVRPDVVLFNGGFFTPAGARDRVVDTLAAWFGTAPRVLAMTALDTAVALGAARYAQIRAGVGPAAALIKAGSGHAYYIGLRAPAADRTIAAVCVLARGTDEGTTTTLGHGFTVSTNTPVGFSLYSSALGADHTGDVVALNPADVHEHTPLVTVLRYGHKSRQVELPIRLSVAFTEVGTLELWCESQISDHRWRLRFQLRGSAEAAAPRPPPEEQAAMETDAVVSDEALAACERVVRSVFDPGAADGTGDAAAEQLVARLEEMAGYAKTTWPIGMIRRLADLLLELAEQRRRTPRIEARWLNLFGFCMRPGFGAAKDPWRVTEARRIYLAGVAFPSSIQNRVEWLVLWQRVAGGFSSGQHAELAQRTMGQLGLGEKKTARLGPQLERESWRLLASLERLDPQTRVKAGDQLLARLARDPSNASLLWAIGRIGARVPFYGPLSSVVPSSAAARWMTRIASFKRLTAEHAATLVQMGALTGDPLRDVDRDTLLEVQGRLRAAGIDGTAVAPLSDIVATAPSDANRVFGEPLPHGLQLGDRPVRS